jgi:hypothetical protein
VRHFLDLGEETVEVNLETPHWVFYHEETRRRQAWATGARLAFWLGLISILIAVVLFTTVL